MLDERIPIKSNREKIFEVDDYDGYVRHFVLKYLPYSLHMCYDT